MPEDFDITPPARPNFSLDTSRPVPAQLGVLKSESYVDARPAVYLDLDQKTQTRRGSVGGIDTDRTFLFQPKSPHDGQEVDLPFTVEASGVSYGVLPYVKTSETPGVAVDLLVYDPKEKELVWSQAPNKEDKIKAPIPGRMDPDSISSMLSLPTLDDAGGQKNYAAKTHSTVVRVRDGLNQEYYQVETDIDASNSNNRTVKARVAPVVAKNLPD